MFFFGFVFYTSQVQGLLKNPAIKRDFQLLKDKINVITLIKDRMIQTEFREGKEITSNTKTVKN